MTTDKGNRTIMSYRPLNKEDIKIYRLAEKKIIEPPRPSLVIAP